MFLSQILSLNCNCKNLILSFFLIIFLIPWWKQNKLPYVATNSVFHLKITCWWINNEYFNFSWTIRLTSLAELWINNPPDVNVPAPKLWNSLPAHIRNAHSLDIFKTSHKTFFFRIVFIWLVSICCLSFVVFTVHCSIWLCLPSCKAFM